MVRYKNFGSVGSQHQTIGSFSFSSQNSQQSSKTTQTRKSTKSKSRSKSKSKSKTRDERSPSITRRESEEDYEEECREEIASRFDPRILVTSSEEEDIKEGEEESLYDMISYNGITDENSMSACASYSYSAGETDSSAGYSDQQQKQQAKSSSPRRAKLSYMGYVPVSPNTAAAMAMIEKREDNNQTHRHRNGNSDSANNNNSGHTTGETTTTTGSTFPPIKMDDTSTSRRRRKDYENYSQSDEEHPRQQYDIGANAGKKHQGQRDSRSVFSGPSVLTDERNADGLREYVSAGQQRELQKQEKEKKLIKDSTTVASSSAADRSHADTSTESSVWPNSCTGHPAMAKMNKGNQYRQQSKDRYGAQDFKPLSPVVASPLPEGQNQSPPRPEAYTDNASLGLSPLTAGFSQYGMIPPSLNHAPAMMQPHWNPSNAHFQHYPNHMPQMHPYGPGGNVQQYQPNPQQYPHQQPQQQPFQSGFVPRNPMLARQLQAFHQYHNQQEKEKQQTSPSIPAPTPPTAVVPRPEDSHSFKPVVGEEKGVSSPSLRSKAENTNASDAEPFLICGPDGPRLNDSVKFVIPTPTRRRVTDSPNDSNGSLSSHSRIYAGSYRSGGGELAEACAQYPGGTKCQSMFANLLNTCGAIVTHGYHTDNTKASSKEKRSRFSKVAEESIAAFAPVAEHNSGDGEGPKEEKSNGHTLMGSGSFALNAKKIFNAGNNMMGSLPKDFHNLTQSAAVHNVFDTFQKYNPTSPVQSEVQSEDGGGIRAALSDDPDEVEAAKEPTKTSMSVVNVQRQHFKQMRRRRLRSGDSPGRKDNSEPTSPKSVASPTSPKSVASPPTSPTSLASKIRGSEGFKARYSRNIHTKAFTKKTGLTGGSDDAREPEEITGVQQSENTNQDPDGAKDEESECSWATPNSREEHNKDLSVSVEKDPPSKIGSSKKNSTDAEVMGDQITGDVVLSTSSGMSDSMIGSDVGDEEPQQLDNMLNSHYEDERQEFVEAEELDVSDGQRILIESYDNDFRHTPLHVIEEESEDEDTTKSVYSKPEDGTETLPDELVVEHSPSDEMSTHGDRNIASKRRSMLSVIGIVRMLFLAMMVLQCGTIVALWDQIADRIRAVEGGSEALTAAEDVVSNLRASGGSLVTKARGIINVDQIDISVEDIFSEIESRTTALMGTANHFVTEMMESDFFQKLKAGTKDLEDEHAQEEQLFRKLVDDAFMSDDAVNDEAIWLEDEEIVSTTESIEVEQKEEKAVEETDQIE